MKVHDITHQEASQIIEKRLPRGLFIEEGKEKYIGIDNSTGDAWTEEFISRPACIAWLNRSC